MNAVLFLPAEILFEVVDYYGSFQGPSQSAKVFDVVSLTGKVVLKMNSVLAIQAMCNQTLSVETVKNFVGILAKFG